MWLILLIFFQHQDSTASSLEKTTTKLDFLTGIDMLLIVQQGIRGGICDVIHKYVKVNNKYMKNYDKNHILRYLR